MGKHIWMEEYVWLPHVDKNMGSSMQLLATQPPPVGKTLVMVPDHAMTLDCVPEGAESAIWLRDPEKRAISSFWYLRGLNWGLPQDDEKARQLSMAFQTPDDFYSCIADRAKNTHFLAAELLQGLVRRRRGLGGDCSTPHTINSTQSWYFGRQACNPTFVGIVDSIDRDWARFLRFMQWPDETTLPHANASVSSNASRKPLGKAASSYIRHRYACDYELLEQFDPATNQLRKR
ncbi:MAG: hypothetical protein WBG92_10335 [Thiohalocapsa sp.]